MEVPAEGEQGMNLADKNDLSPLGRVFLTIKRL